MNVLSLFDGMSCGRITLSELGISVEKYYASEVDKFAIKATMQNFPDIIQVGDVRELPLIFNSPDCNSEKGFRTPNITEAERLQTVPEGYTKSVQPHIGMGLLGNGWTVDVISHIFKGMKQ